MLQDFATIAKRTDFLLADVVTYEIKDWNEKKTKRTRRKRSRLLRITTENENQATDPDKELKFKIFRRGTRTTILAVL